MSHPKFRIYQGIACLETPSPTGHRWWDQGLRLAYTPYPIARITRVQYGTLQGSGRMVLAAWLEAEQAWVAINLPRSDILALQAAGLYPSTMPQPYTERPNYSPPPA